MKQRNKPRPAAVFGVDIGKNIFHVVGVDTTGQPVQKVRFRRDTLLQFFESAEPALIGMESCPGRMNADVITFSISLRTNAIATCRITQITN